LGKDKDLLQVNKSSSSNKLAIPYQESNLNFGSQKTQNTTPKI